MCRGCVGGFWLEQAHADQSPVAIDTLDRVSGQLELAHDGGREVNRTGVQFGESDRLIASPAGGRRIARAWRRGSSAAWLCGACLLLALGASPCSAATSRVHQAADEPMCCFRLSINDWEHAYADIDTTNGFHQTTKGEWQYVVGGTAYGLAELEPFGGLLSLYGGVASGGQNETNFVTLSSPEGGTIYQHFGCPNAFDGSNSRDPYYERLRVVEKPYPEYVPPAHGGAGDVDFGSKFDKWGYECAQWSDAEGAIGRAIGRPCANSTLLTGPSAPGGAPMCGSKLNPYRALRSGEHEVNIKCIENAHDVMSGEGYEITAYVAILITIVHVSPDDRKHQRQVLRGLVGKKPPSPAREMVEKMQMRPEPMGQGQLLCTSST